jgi:hypothetical protein
VEFWGLDNPPAHSALSVLKFLDKKEVIVILYSPYTPDIAPCDFFCFKKLKMVLKRMRFCITMMQAKLQDAVTEYQTEHFMKCFD